MSCKCNGILSLHTLLSCSVFLTFMTWLVLVFMFLFGAGFDGLLRHAMTNKYCCRIRSSFPPPLNSNFFLGL